MLLPASAFLLVLAEPVVRLVFQRGEFDADSTAAHLRGALLLRHRAGLQRREPAGHPRASSACSCPGCRPRSRRSGVVLNAALDAALLPALRHRRHPALDLAVEHRDLRRSCSGCWSASSAGCTAPGSSTASLRGLVASGVSALLAWSVWRVLDDALGRGSLGADRLASARRSRPPRSPTSRPRTRSRCPSCAPLCAAQPAATMSARGPAPHPQLLHHRPHRPRQVDAGGPHPPAHRTR